MLTASWQTRLRPEALVPSGSSAASRRFWPRGSRPSAPRCFWRLRGGWTNKVQSRIGALLFDQCECYGWCASCSNLTQSDIHKKGVSLGLLMQEITFLTRVTHPGSKSVASGGGGSWGCCGTLSRFSDVALNFGYVALSCSSTFSPDLFLNQCMADVFCFLSSLDPSWIMFTSQ